MNKKSDKFLELWDDHRGQLFGFIFSIVQSISDTEDVFQQVSLVLWDHFEQLDADDDFLRWACTVAKNKAIDHLRKQSRDRHCFSDALLDQLATLESTGEEYDNTERTDALNHCMEKLSKKDRELIRCCYTSNSSIKSVSQKIDRPTGAVYDSLSRIRRILYHCINRFMTRGKV